MRCMLRTALRQSSGLGLLQATAARRTRDAASRFMKRDDAMGSPTLPGYLLFGALEVLHGVDLAPLAVDPDRIDAHPQVDQMLKQIGEIRDAPAGRADEGLVLASGMEAGEAAPGGDKRGGAGGGEFREADEFPGGLLGGAGAPAGGGHAT